MGDNNDNCKSLACVNGQRSYCLRESGEWSKRKVTCAKQSVFCKIDTDCDNGLVCGNNGVCGSKLCTWKSRAKVAKEAGGGWDNLGRTDYARDCEALVRQQRPAATGAIWSPKQKDCYSGFGDRLAFSSYYEACLFNPEKLCYCEHKNGGIPKNGIMCGFNGVLFTRNGYCSEGQRCTGATKNDGYYDWKTERKKKDLCTNDIKVCYCEHKDGGISKNGIMCGFSGGSYIRNGYCSGNQQCTGATKDKGYNNWVTEDKKGDMCTNE